MKLKHRIFLFFYRYFFLRAILVLTRALSPWIPKIKEGLRLRKNAFLFPSSNPSQGKTCIWFHCSSGEIEYAKPLIRKLKETQPDCFILCTYYSPSVVSNLQKNPDIDFFLPTPLESPSLYSKLISYFQPKALLVARTDIWLEMLLAAKKHNVPSYLFSATLTAGSSRTNSPLARWLYSWAHSLFTAIYCVTEEDKRQFLSLSPEIEVHVSGDSRYDQVLWRLEQAETLNVFSKPLDSQPNILCGSTWPEDEKEVLACFKRLQERSIPYRLIITPHEPSPQHIELLSRSLQAHELSYQLYSQSTEFHAQVMIVDKVGILASLYPHSDIAIIGGAFRSSIHSVMEGLAAGCFCLFGPHYKNNREAIEFSQLSFQGMPYASSCKNSEELFDKILNFYQQKNTPAFKQSLKTEIQSFTGTTDKILKTLEPILAPKKPSDTKESMLRS